LLYSYLNNLKLSKWASLLGAFTFSFSGFFISWLEWGTIIHVGLWLPLILLSIDKITSNIPKKHVWLFAYLISMIFSFFAGHLQTFFYVAIFSFCYFLSKWWQYGRKKNILILYIVFNVLFIILSSVQWIPTLQLISLSARGIDVISIDNPGWLIPWQHMIQFVVPDFFGNPTTLNYWGVWNYGELVGYIGIMPLILALFAMFYRRDKKTLFFGTAFFMGLIFSFPTYFAKIPYLLKIPYLSTAQPTRLLFIIDFALAVLSSLGFDYLLRIKRKVAIISPLVFISIVLVSLWVFIPKGHLLVVKSNLLLPTILLAISVVLLIVLINITKNKKFTVVICTTILAISLFDLFRFGWKFTSFTQRPYLFPPTKTLSFLQKNLGDFRIMATDSRIFPPNFPAVYKLQSLDGYDPLYLLRYGELIAASERKKADITPPFGFNRIITPHNYESRIADLLGVKYVLSFSTLNVPKLVKVFQEGQTMVYENKNVIPRAFFVNTIKLSENKEESMKMLFDTSIDLTRAGIVENQNENLNLSWSVGSANIIQYDENKVIIDTKNEDVGFLILTDTFYPTWKASIDGKRAKIFVTDYNFRGVIVPSGKHIIEFYDSLF